MIEDTMENLILIIGVPTETTWSICTELSAHSIQVSLALTVRDQNGHASEIGRELIHQLQTWVESAPTFVQALAYFPKLSVPVECELVLWYRQDDLSLFAVDNGVVGVKRQGKYFEILTSNQKLQCVQGALHPEDVLLFGTSEFQNTLMQTFSAASDPMMTAAKYLKDERALVASVCGQVCLISPTTVTVTPRPPDENIRSVSLTTPVMVKTGKTIVPSYSILWLLVSPRYKKIVTFIFCCVFLVSSILLLQKFLLNARLRRIQGATAPLAARLSTITASSEPRMEKEKELAQLLSDTTQAQSNSGSDLAVRRELDIFIEKVKSAYIMTSMRKEIDHLSVFYDFRLISTDFVASQIQYDIPGKLAVFVDTARGKIVSLSIEKKQPQALSLNTDVGKLQSLTIVNRRAYLLGQSGIYEVSLPLDTQGKVVASASGQWQSPRLIGSFAKNVYVFDPDARQIFRYDTEDFSASPSAWLRGKEGVDFDSIHSLAIDGDIWMGTSQGGVYKFSRGDRMSFAYKDILNPPQTSIALYSAELLPNIYLLEPREKRILIFDKQGSYVSSIVSQDLESATSLIVNEDGTRAYVLSGSLVYEVEL